MNVGVGLIVIGVVALGGLHYARTVLAVSERAAAREPTEHNPREVRHARVGIWVQAVIVLVLVISGIAIIVAG